MNIERIILIMYVLLRFSNFSMGQTNDLEWAPIGATWTYELSSISGESPSSWQIVSVGDTTIQNKVCKILDSPFYEGAPIYLYQSKDTIFRYIDNSFRILYNFSLSPGDTLDISVPNMGCPNNIYTIQIDSVGKISFGDDSLRVQWLRIPEDPFGDCPLAFGATLVEKIGGLGFILPQDILADPPSSSGLLSYSDNRCNLFYFDETLSDCIFTDSSSLCAYQVACDTVVSNKFSIRELLEVSVFPSPAMDDITLHSTTEKFHFEQVALYDLTGKNVAQLIPGNTKEVILNVSHLNNGIYLLQVEIDQAWYTHKVQIQR